MSPDMDSMGRLFGECNSTFYIWGLLYKESSLMKIVLGTTCLNYIVEDINKYIQIHQGGVEFLG